MVVLVARSVVPEQTPTCDDSADDEIITVPVHAYERLLCLLGVGLAIGLGTYACVWVNFPNGHQTAFGMHPPSIDLFRQVLPYPHWNLESATFTKYASTALLISWFAYIVALVATRFAPADPSGRRPRLILLATAVIAGGLAVGFPTVLSADVFHYAMHGRMLSLHGWNPYVVSGDAMGEDVFHYLAVWRDIRTQYGPLWTLIATGITAISGDSVFATAISFKILAAAAHIVSAAIVWRVATHLPGASAERALVLYAWNPLLLLESAGSGHNDFVMMALGLAGAAAFVSGRSNRGIILLVLSAGVKYISLLLAFFCATHALGRIPPGQRLRAATCWIATGVALAVAMYAPFAAGTENVSQLWAGLAPETNPMPNNFGVAVRRFVATPFCGTTDATLAGNLVLNSVFAIALLMHGIRVMRQHETWASVFGGYALASFAYAYIVFAGSQPWYLLSPLAAAALAGENRLSFYFLAACFGLAIGFGMQATVIL